ncbi:MAG: DUF1566 domain-containing protein [Bacteroidales bacterium]|nr:DUF1566 domain-containing protein [Bacteroidales bacterium]
MERKQMSHIMLQVVIAAIASLFVSCGNSIVESEVSEVGEMYMHFDGKVAIGMIPKPFVSVEVGVEVDSLSDFSSRRRFKALPDSSESRFHVKVDHLQPGKSYYCRGYIYVYPLYTRYGATHSFSTELLTADNGHVYVDLGLPSNLYWATCNVGANSPEEFGSYYAWGETTAWGEETQGTALNRGFGSPSIKTTFDWGNYKFCAGSFTSLTKYNTHDKFGTVDGLCELDLADDAASVNWGGAWRMPTEADWNELREHCRWRWRTYHGVGGYEVIGENGNSIFLPAAGCRSGDEICCVGAGGDYWSSTLSKDYPYSAVDVRFYSSGVYVDRRSFGRSNGRSVRAVYPIASEKGATGASQNEN